MAARLHSGSATASCFAAGACRFALNLTNALPQGAKEEVLQVGSRAEQDRDLNWHAVLGMMALALVSFGLYGAAMGTYLTLMD